MNSDPIRQLLHDADQRMSRDVSSDAADLANRVLKARTGRRKTRVVASITVFTISLTALLIVNHKTLHPTQNLVVDHKPAIQSQAEIVGEIRDLEVQVAANEQIIRRLKAIETIERAEAQIARLQAQEAPEQAVAERAASAVVYQTDRMYRSTGYGASALQAYREVIEHFPGTASAELAKQRVSDIERAG